MYQETKKFRKTIDRLIEIATSSNSIAQDFSQGGFKFNINFKEEVKAETVNNQYQTESYLISSSKGDLKYEIFGYRTLDKSFYIVELNKWSRKGNTFLLNNEVNAEKGESVLKEIETIVDSIIVQQSDTTLAA